MFGLSFVLQCLISVVSSSFNYLPEEESAGCLTYAVYVLWLLVFCVSSWQGCGLRLWLFLVIVTRLLLLTHINLSTRA